MKVQDIKISFGLVVGGKKNAKYMRILNGS